jgi:hypothetical protein
VCNHQFVKDMLENEGPLSTFSARISIAYAVGLLAHQLHKTCILYGEFAMASLTCPIPLRFRHHSYRIA